MSSGRRLSRDKGRARTSSEKEDQQTVVVPKTQHEAWVLGERYLLDDHGRNKLSLHAQSFFRFTYRRDFPALSPYTYSSDAGWGCMIRAAQMLMGYALRRHYLGSGWRLPQGPGAAEENEDYCKVLRWFQDFPGHAHIYSIQHMVQCGMKYDKLPGEWWGPSTASYVLRDLARVHRMAYHGPVAVHVTQTDAVYISDIEALCANLSLNDCLLGLTESAAAQRAQNMKHVNSSIALHNRSIDPQDPLPCEASEEVDAFFDPLFHPPPSATSPWTCGLILLIPLRLGVNTVNAEYFDCLKEALRQECCVGILGGRVGHAIYFTGYDSSTDMLYGLDPHTVFAASESIHDVQKQIHVDGFVQLSIASLDPSLALGFYFADREAFDRFCKHYHSSKLISIQHTAPSYMMEDDCMDEGVPAWMAGFFDGNTGISKGGGKTNYDSDEDDDYVIITK